MFISCGGAFLLVVGLLNQNAMKSRILELFKNVSTMFLGLLVFSLETFKVGKLEKICKIFEIFEKKFRKISKKLTNFLKFSNFKGFQRKI